MTRIVALLDTSIASLNKGDSIIMQAVHRELDDKFADDFVIDLPTHTVSFPPLKSLFWSRAEAVRNAQYKIIGGTDIFWPNMLMRPNPLFNISFLNYRPFKGVVFCGVGMNSKKGSKRVNLYSRLLWKSVLSKDLIHSTRDNATKECLERMGLKAVNTGCPTMWSLTPEFCTTIPRGKAPAAITALSDKHNVADDQQLLNLLREHYDKVYLWLQGHYDNRYIETLEGIEDIEIVAPSVKAYDEVLSREDVDYVGPRLHAGIFALQHARRSVILGVDHRASTFASEVNLPYLARSDYKGIAEWITSEHSTEIRMDFEAINLWKNQF